MVLPLTGGKGSGGGDFFPPRPLFRFFSVTILSFFLLPSAQTADLQDKTVRAWDRYLQWADSKVQRELSTERKFRIEDHFEPKKRAEIRLKLHEGEIVTGKVSGVVPSGTSFSVPDGEIHHWWGGVYIPDITLSELLAFLQDYDRHADLFDDVEKSKLLSQKDGKYRFMFRLKRSQALVTAVFNTEQECVYKTWDEKRVSSRSVATKIAEVEDADTPKEREKPPGKDRGFMWRLVSWWRFEQVGDGVVVELESASLSRDIPLGVRVVPGVSDYIRSTPRKSLESVLTTIREFAKSRKNKPAAP